MGHRCWHLANSSCGSWLGLGLSAVDCRLLPWLHSSRVFAELFFYERVFFFEMLGWKALTEQTLNAFQMELAMKEAEEARDPTDSESEQGSAGSIPLSAQTSDEALRHWIQ